MPDEIKTPSMPKVSAPKMPKLSMPKLPGIPKIDTERIAQTAKEFMEEFGVKYAKNFGLGLLLAAKESKAEAEDERALRKFEPVPPALKGEVKMSTDGSAKTVTRYFKVNEDWHVEIYKNEAAANADEPKPLKVFNPLSHWATWWTPPTKEFPLRRGGPEWKADKEFKTCSQCNVGFSLIKRKHHCRTCGEVCCAQCVENKWDLTEIGYTKGKERVCRVCLVKLTEKGLKAFDFGEAKQEKDVKQYGIKVTHWYGQGLHFLVESSDLQSDWVYGLRECTYNAKTFENPVASLNYAFQNSFQEVWYNQGPWWRRSDSFAAEEDMLGYLLAWIMNRRVTPELLEAMPMQNAKVRAAVEKAVEKGAISAVQAAWPPLVKKMEEAEKPIKDKVTELTGPFFEAENKMKDGISDKVGTALSTALEAVLKPVKEKFLGSLFTATENAYAHSFPLLDPLVAALKERIGDEEDQKSFARKCRYTRWKISHSWGDASVREHVFQKDLQPLREELDALNLPKVDAYQLVYEIEKQIKDLMEDYLFTIEQHATVQAALGKKKDDLVKAIDSVIPEVKAQYLEDAKAFSAKNCEDFLSNLLLGPLDDGLSKVDAIEDGLKALDDAIPESLQEFLSASSTFEDVKEDSIGTAVGGLMESCNFGEALDKAFAESSGGDSASSSGGDAPSGDAGGSAEADPATEAAE
jgi:hypothetical protein